MKEKDSKIGEKAAHGKQHLAKPAKESKDGLGHLSTSKHVRQSPLPPEEIRIGMKK